MSPNDYTYATVIEALCRKGDMEEAVHVFQEMEESGVTPRAFAYTDISKGFAPIGGHIWENKCYKHGKGHLSLMMHVLMLLSFVGSVTRMVH